MLIESCAIDRDGAKLLATAAHRLSLTARAYDLVRKVARTIADLDVQENILPAHLSEAIQYRSLDRRVS